jgi:hypothetical protein
MKFSKFTFNFTLIRGFVLIPSYGSPRLESTRRLAIYTSCEGSVIMVFSAQLAEGGSARPHSFTLSTPSTRVSPHPPPPPQHY